MTPGAADLAAHLDAYVAVAATRWCRGLDGTPWEGGLRDPVARTSLTWPEMFTVPTAAWWLAAHAAGSPPTIDPAAHVDRRVGRIDRDAVVALLDGLCTYLARTQRPDGSLDAGFDGDVAQGCNAAFALRPLAEALVAWPGDPALREARARLEAVVARAAAAAADLGMNTPNHRWVAAAGLAHAARALGDARWADAAHEWTAVAVDIDADGAYSEGSPNYALVSDDCFLDLEALLGRRDLGDLARRSLAYLRAVTMPDGSATSVASSRYDTEGSTDTHARAAHVLARLGAPDLAAAALRRLWSARVAPGVVAPDTYPPAGAAPKAKLYPSVTSAIANDCLRRLLVDPALDLPLAPAVAPALAPAAPPPVERSVLTSSGVVVHRAGSFAAAVARGLNLLDVRAGDAVLEGARLLVHTFGWLPVWVTEQVVDGDAVRMALASAPGDPLPLPQYHRTSAAEKTPGTVLPNVTGHLAVRFGAGRGADDPTAIDLDLTLDGPPRAHALLDLAVRPGSTVHDADGVPVATPHAVGSGAGRVVVKGRGPDLLVIDHDGGSGHALQVERYGYGDGDRPWSPSFRPLPVRIGLELPCRLRVRIHAA